MEYYVNKLEFIVNTIFFDIIDIEEKMIKNMLNMKI